MKKRIISVICCWAVVSGMWSISMQETVEDAVVTVATSQEVLTENESAESITEEPAADTETEETSVAEEVEPTPEEPEVQVEETEEVQEDENEYSNLAIADVDRYVNVRSQPSTESEIVGKIYDGAVAEVQAVAGEQEEWFQISSGNVEGYIKAEFFLYGEDAAAVIDQYMNRYVEVQADRLNVRAEQSTDSDRIGYIDNGQKVELIEDCGEWLCIQYTQQKKGYVAAEYAIVQEEFAYAKTLEEDRAELAARETPEQGAIAPIKDIVFPSTTYSSNEELRKEIINYALQFVGDKYVNGGTSLATGTDCSGFTCFIYADFGYSISRIPDGQYTGAGRSIDYSEIQPGDIICYSSNGGKSCTHVALYIGDGQIVHAANSRKGVITSAADYEPIIGIRNVID